MTRTRVALLLAAALLLLLPAGPLGGQDEATFGVTLVYLPKEGTDDAEVHADVLRSLPMAFLELRARGIEPWDARRTGKYAFRFVFRDRHAARKAEIEAVLRSPPRLQFRLVAKKEMTAIYPFPLRPPGGQWVKCAEGIKDGYLLSLAGRTGFTNAIIKSAYPSEDEMGLPAVGFEVREEYQALLKSFTYENSDDRRGGGNGRQLAIVADGVVVSAPVIRSGISDSGIITGGEKGFSPADQRRLIEALTAKPGASGVERQATSE
jgi:hypothetical protein